MLLRELEQMLGGPSLKRSQSLSYAAIWAGLIGNILIHRLGLLKQCKLKWNVKVDLVIALVS